MPLLPARPLASLLLLAAAPLTAQSTSRPESRGAAILAQLRSQAEALRPLAASSLVRGFLDATAQLPEPTPRFVYQKRMSREHLSEAGYLALAADSRPAFERVTITPERYYTTFYGSPLAYVRALELAAGAGFTRAAGARVLDFGYGGVGHLRLLASQGAQAVGVDIDSFLAALYARPEDQGTVKNADGPDGRITLVHGQWPAQPAAVTAVGKGFDLILSKNTLKRGYVHPEREADPRRLVHLGVDDQAFARALFDALEPGGLVLIYNLAPAQSPPDKPFIPWADGRCPFARELLQATGFEVVAYDQDDHAAAHAMARALEWDQGPQAMDLAKDLFAHYTLLRRPRQ